jgi:PKD repeat protein
MAEQAPGDHRTSKLGAWLKGLITSVLGLCSGAVLMYASPLIDRAVKPAKPLANFAAQPQGIQVAFQNRTTGATEGWWDFGDGTALEPFVPSQPVVSHTYPKSGTYTCKLSVRNLIGEEHDRAVNINLDDAASAKPSIEALTVRPVGPGTCAPAIFHVTGKVKNAELCVWDLGDKRPLQIVTDTTHEQDRLITFKHPGTHVIRLAAFNGKQADEKSQVVVVTEPPKGTATVALSVKREAVQIRSITTPRTVSVPFPAQSHDAGVPLNVTIPADNGFQFTRAAVVSADYANNVQATVSSDHLQVKLTGQQTRPTNLLRIPNRTPPAALIQLTLTQVRQTPPQQVAMEPVESPLAVPGSTALPIPKVDAGWTLRQQNLSVELRDGERVVWQSAQLPASAVVLLQGRQCQVHATVAGDQVRVDLTPTGARLELVPVGN